MNNSLPMCAPSVSGESDRAAYESVGGGWIKMRFDLGYCHGNVSACMCICAICRCEKVFKGRKERWKEGGTEGRKEDRKVGPLSLPALNEGLHCARPGGSLLVLLFALLICMLMYLFYGSTVLIHFKINYPSGTPIPRPGSNAY